MDAKQIGEVIKEPRKRKEMTQEEQLANMLGIGILTASFYKNGVFKAIPYFIRMVCLRLFLLLTTPKCQVGQISLTRKWRASAQTRLSMN